MLPRALGYDVVAAAIKEETSPEIESRGATVHWLSPENLTVAKMRRLIRFNEVSEE